MGQPELVTGLGYDELRQLTQRISLSCRLLPLDLSETSAYIASRCSVAAKKSIMPFSGTAVRMIHQYSGGIPRLINIACDRALLVGFNEEEPRITPGIVRKALGEVSALKSGKPAQRLFANGLPLEYRGFGCVAASFIALFRVVKVAIDPNNPRNSQCFPTRHGNTAMSHSARTAANQTPIGGGGK